jgi:hypothetical protein
LFDSIQTYCAVLPSCDGQFCSFFYRTPPAHATAKFGFRKRSCDHLWNKAAAAEPYCQTASAIENRRPRKICSRRGSLRRPRFEAVAYFLNASKSRSPVCARCRIRAAIACRRLSSRGPMSEQARSSTAVKKAKSLDSKKDTNIVDSLSNQRHLGFVSAREWGTLARRKIDH